MCRFQPTSRSALVRVVRRAGCSLDGGFLPLDARAKRTLYSRAALLRVRFPARPNILVTPTATPTPFRSLASMVDSPVPDADSVAAESEESRLGASSRPSATAELGHIFGPLIDAFREFFGGDHPQRQQRLIGAWIVVGLLVGAVGWNLYDTAAFQGDAGTWGKWTGIPSEVNEGMMKTLKDGGVLNGVGAFRVKAYNDFLNKNADATPEVRAWARLLLAEARLGEALRRGYVSDKNASREKGDRRIRTGTNDDIRKAKTAFEDVRDNSPEGSDMRQRALYGLAIIAEATSSGKDDSIKAAVKAYEKLEATEGPYKSLAKRRIEALAKRAATDFYKWFAEVAETPAADPVTPALGSGANAPQFDPSSLLEGLTDGDDKSSPHQPAPNSSTKDERKIPESVPLPGKKPAAKKPAAKKPDAKKPDAKKSDE